jgi:hypothetical protein
LFTPEVTRVILDLKQSASQSHDVYPFGLYHAGFGLCRVLSSCQVPLPKSNNPTTVADATARTHTTS